MSPSDTLLKIRDQVLRVSLDAVKSRVVVNVRWQYKGENGRLLPDKRGVTFDASALPQIITALEAIKSQMISDGALVDSDPPKYNPAVYPANF